MKVLLVQPRVCAEAAFPLGLASLVPALRAAGHQVEGIDLCFSPLEAAIATAARADAVGVTVMTRALPQVRALVSGLRQATPGRHVPVVLGGPHPTLFPVEVLQHTGADAAVRGDGEHLFPRVLELLDTITDPVSRSDDALDRIDGSGSVPAAPEDAVADPVLLPDVAWRRGARVLVGPHAPSPDPDAMPFADRDVFPFRRYSLAMRSIATPYTTMVTSRGCRRHCAWCPAPRLRPEGFSGRSPAHVYDEMAWLAGRYGVRDIHFEDDDPLADRARFEALCERLVRRPLPLIWECVNGIPPERLDPPLLALMARAGCRALVISIEALEPGEAPDKVGYRFDRVRSLVRAAERYGTVVGGYFMVGLPGEDYRDMLRTVRLSYRLGLARANYSPFQWLPGSRYGDARHQHAGDTSSPMWATRIAAAAHVGFYLHPRPLRSLLWDVARHPGVLPALARKAVEQLAGRAGA